MTLSSNIQIVALSILLWFTGCAPAPDRARTDAPNLLLFLVDTLRSDALSNPGETSSVSPTLDSLATRGMTLETLVSPSPWTRPAIGALFTSRYPTELGIDHGGHHGVMQVLPEHVPTLPQVMADAGYATAAVVANPHLKFWTQFDRGFEHFEFIDHRREALFRDRAETVLDSLSAGDRPFFFYVHLMDPHLPYRNHGLEPGAPPTEPGRFRPNIVRRNLLTSPDLPPDLKGHIRNLYKNEVAHADRWIGRMLQVLRRSGHGDRTVIAVTSDHGEEHWDHGGAEHGHTLHRELLQVPGIIVPSRSPDPSGFGGICDAAPAPLRHPSLARLIDLAPTLGTLTGSGAWKDGRGQSLVPGWLGGHPVQSSPAIGEALLYGPQYRSLREGRWKLIRHPEGDRLYDLESDPEETTDLLAGSTDHSNAIATAQALAARLDSVVSTFETTEISSVEIDETTRKELEALGYLGS